MVHPRIKCADGFSLSVQASWGHYCRDATGKRPNMDSGDYTAAGGATLPFTAVEIGYPSVQPEPWRCTAWADGYDVHDDHGTCDGWERYAETSDDPTETVYAFVPVEMVRALIALHGGEPA